MLAEHPDLDALFVASDLMAVGALAVLADAGRLVPSDVALVGYDNLGAATTMLIDRLSGTSVDQAPVIFAAELVIRDSA